MTDKATLIEHLEDAAERVQEAGFRGHGTVSRTIAEAVEALKAQEPVKPILKRKALNAMYNDYVCPICNQEIVYEQKYCCECGMAVKWDD